MLTSLYFFFYSNMQENHLCTHIHMKLLGPCVVNNSNEKDNVLPGYFSNSVKEGPTFTVVV